MNTEEKITEKMIENEEKVDKSTEDRENIINGYIEYIRNISKLADGKIESTIIGIIDKDEKFLEVLRRFLEESKELSDKIASFQDDEDDEEDEDKAKEIDDILKIFEDPNYAYPLEDIVASLDAGYECPGEIIVSAIKDNILYIDDIDEDQAVFIALTTEGNSLWKLR